MKRNTIYLCGGMAGCSDAECMEWRNKVIAKLGDQFDFLNPMRRDYRFADFLHRDFPNTAEATNKIKNIIEQDFEDIDNSDILLVKADEPSWGTAMEIHYGWTHFKEVVTFCDNEFPSPWLRYHSHYFLRTLDEAIELLKTFEHKIPQSFKNVMQELRVFKNKKEPIDDF